AEAPIADAMRALAPCGARGVTSIDFLVPVSTAPRADIDFAGREAERPEAHHAGRRERRVGGTAFAAGASRAHADTRRRAGRSAAGAAGIGEYHRRVHRRRYVAAALLHGGGA